MKPADYNALKKALGGKTTGPVIVVNDRQRISDAFGLEPSSLGAAMKSALGKGAGAWEAYSTLLAAFERYLLTDGRLRAVYDKLRRRVAKLKWKISPAANDPQGEEIAAEIEAMLQNIGRFRHTVLYELTDAIGSGFAAVELDGAVIDGRLAVTGARGVEQWALRPSETIPGQWEHKTDNGWLPVPPGKLLVWSLENKGRFITGGLMWPALWLAMFKNYGFKDWLSFVEIYGQPLRVGTYDPAASAEDQALLAQAVIDIAADAGVVIPKGCEIDFKDAIKGNAQAHERLVQRIDSYFDELFLGGTLTMEQGDKGARGLGDVHDEQLDEIVEFYGQDLGESIDAGLIRPVVDSNHGQRPDYPRFGFVFWSIRDQVRRWQIDQGLLAAAAPVTEQYIFQTYGLPEPQEGDRLVRPPQSLAPNPAAPTVAEVPAACPHCAAESGTGDDADQMIDGLVARGESAMGDLYGPLIEALIAAGENPTIPQTVRRAFRAAYADRLAPALIAANLAGLEVVLQNARREGVGNQIDLDQAVTETWDGLQARRQTVAEARVSALAAVNLQDGSLAAKMDWKKIDPQKALAWWARKTSVPASKVAELEGIAEALKTGSTMRDFAKTINAACEKAGVSPLAPWHLQTVWRQNLLTAFGAGRVAAQHSPEVKKYLPFKTYRIADGKARPTHRALDGVTKPVDDPFWDQYEPPWEFGCRCRTEAKRRMPDDATEPASYPQTPAGFENPLTTWKKFVEQGGQA